MVVQQEAVERVELVPLEEAVVICVSNDCYDDASRSRIVVYEPPPVNKLKVQYYFQLHHQLFDSFS